MADIINLQELADAKLDAQSLERFINGGVDEEVLTRLSQQYPTMQNFLLQFQKHNSRAYKTYALMDADKTNIPAKSKVTVTNDATASNNGDWQWDGTTLTKSAYDPLTQAKNYTNTVIVETIALKKSDDPDIICLSADANGNALIWIDKATGVGHVVGMLKNIFERVIQLKSYNDPDIIAGELDSNGNVLWGVRKTTGKFFAAGLDAVSSVQQKSYKYFAQKPIAAEVNHMLSYGESLSVGATATTIISSTQPYFNTTFDTSPRQDTVATSVVPLVEQFAAMSADGYPNNRGETHCSGAANYASLELLKSGISPSTHNIFASTAGQGGATVAELAKGGVAYTRLLNHISKAKELNAGKTYKSFFTPFIIGTNDAAATTSYSSFRAKLEEVCTDINTDIKAASGQSENVVFAITQVSYAAKTQPQIAKALLDLANEDDRFLFVTPLYHLPYSEGIHLTNIGYKWLGAYIGRVYSQYYNDGRHSDYINPLSAYISGNKIVVKFDVPTVPLKIDTTTLASTTNAGFKVMSGSNEITITSVTASDDTVILQLASTPASNVQVRYALDYLGFGLNIANGASGNLRDSTTDSIEIAGQIKPLYHVCPHFELTAFLDKGI